jgi:hypothetical protein
MKAPTQTFKHGQTNIRFSSGSNSGGQNQKYHAMGTKRMKCRFCGLIASRRTLKGGHAIKACNTYAMKNPEICRKARMEYEEQDRQIRLTKISVGPEKGTESNQIALLNNQIGNLNFLNGYSL